MWSAQKFPGRFAIAVSPLLGDDYFLTGFEEVMQEGVAERGSRKLDR